MVDGLAIAMSRSDRPSDTDYMRLVMNSSSVETRRGVGGLGTSGTIAAARDPSGQTLRQSNMGASAGVSRSGSAARGPPASRSSAGHMESATEEMEIASASRALVKHALAPQAAADDGEVHGSAPDLRARAAASARQDASQDSANQIAEASRAIVMECSPKEPEDPVATARASRFLVSSITARHMANGTSGALPVSQEASEGRVTRAASGKSTGTKPAATAHFGGFGARLSERPSEEAHFGDGMELALGRSEEASSTNNPTPSFSAGTDLVVAEAANMAAIDEHQPVTRGASEAVSEVEDVNFEEQTW